MKKITICFLLLTLTLTSFCQDNPTKADYLKKSKTQKTVGFILLGAGGIALVSISGPNTELNTAAGVVILAGAAIITSIPFFIASGHNKRKANAMALSFDLQKNAWAKLSDRYLPFVPAITLKLPLPQRNRFH
jgi:drug/metabolite transporter (DMT)-like permease